MTEPTGHTMDGTPWVEPRGPHLPDRLMAVGWLAWPFVILAGILAGLAWPRIVDAASGDAVQILAVAIGQLDPVGVALLGAALFVRHPGAIRTLPHLVVGVTLLAVREVLRVLGVPLDAIFAGITPPSEAFPFFVPFSTAYHTFASVLGVFGLLYLARGLDEARRLEDGRASRPLAVLLASLAVGLGLIQYQRLGDLPADDTGIIGILVVSSITLTTLNLLAWAFLTWTVARGWRAGEAPSGGWLAAVLAGACVFISWATTTALGLLVTGPSDLAVAAIQIAGAIASVAWLLLLVAFAVGLPSTRALSPEEVADGDGADPTLDPAAASMPGSART
ncbi:MAG: hypothetical protein ABIQ58_07600 [Candidatus Limnocylindrales bacterium]